MMSKKSFVVILVVIFSFPLLWLVFMLLTNDRYYEMQPIRQGKEYVWICETEDFSANFSVVDDLINGRQVVEGEFCYNDITEQFILIMPVSTRADFSHSCAYGYESYFVGDVEYGDEWMEITVNEVRDERFADMMGETYIFYKQKKE